MRIAAVTLLLITIFAPVLLAQTRQLPVETGRLGFCDGKLEYSAFGGGYFDPDKGTMYYVTDWQGNNAAVIDKNGNIIQQTIYYPYGEPTIEPMGQRYLFGGKEREHAGGRNSYDFGARCLTPYGNWGVVDQMAEKFYPISPYSYCGGDPINHIDKDGNVFETLWDIGNVFYDIYAAVDAHIEGDHERARQHWIDAGFDVISAVIPGVPAGTSKVVKAVDAVKGMKNPNRIQSGKKFGKECVQKATGRGEKVATEKTLVPLNGKGDVKGNRTRTDMLKKDNDGHFIIGEAKLTDKTRLSKGQLSAKKHVEQGDGIFEVRSKINEFGLKPGDKIHVKKYDVITKEKLNKTNN